MAILFMDGFDHYGGTVNNIGAENMLNGPWTGSDLGINIGVPSWGPARTGPFCFGSIAAQPRHILPGARAQVFLSCGVAVDAIPSHNLANSICIFADSGNVTMANLFIQADGSLLVADKNNATLAVSNGPVVVARNWHFFEILYDKTNSKFTVRVDDATGSGTPVIDATISFSQNCSQVAICGNGFGTSVQQWCDDVLIRDTSGTVNNGWLGDRRVATLFADQDTTTAGWTPSYYQRFGPGILRLQYLIAGASGVQGAGSSVAASAASEFDIGSNDFTLETSIRFDALPQTTQYATIFNRWNTIGDNRSYQLVYGGSGYNGNCIQFNTSTDGTAATVASPIIYPWVPETDVWYTIALVRSAGELLLFVNGVQLGLPIADSSTYFSGGNANFTLGAELQNNIFVTNTGLTGRLDETRFTNGVARYTTTYTPATTAFPRGSGSDPDWSDVTLLCGYDNGISDDSLHAHTLTARGSAISFIVNDGPLIGTFSTVNKPAPDDNTFIAASFLPAVNILTMTTQPANTNTVTLGTTDGTTPAVYKFVTSLVDPFDVLIDTSAALTLTNLLQAINSGTGSGTKYGAGTTANFDVSASPLLTGQIEVTANISGTVGNSIVSTATGTAAVWDTTTLTGGQDIPGPTSYRLQRPPNNTTIISGLQVNIRALKTDAGLADIQSTLIGGEGTETDGADHPLTTSVNYYADIFEADPDTGGPISPTTIINGQVKINRTV